MRRLPLLTLMLGSWSVLTPAFTQQPESPILSVTTDLVTLSVTVVDRQGVLVSGLRREHFTVFDNGVPQTIQFFSNEDLPATVGLVIDSSGSMRGRQQDVAAAATAFTSISHPLAEFFTVNFNERVWPGLPADVLFTDDAEQLRAALTNVPAQGLSALYDAVDRALTHLEFGTRDRKALIIVSDGGDNASTRRLGDVLEHARRASAVIYSVTIFDIDNRDARPAVLKALAAQSGGRAFTPRQSDGIATSFAQIAREIRSGYTIGFMPADTATPGYRSLRVTANPDDRRELVVRTRAGYYAGAH